MPDVRRNLKPVFIKNLAIVLDAMQELSELSLALQNANITLPNCLYCPAPS